MPISWSQDAFDDLEAIYTYLGQYDPHAAVHMLHAVRAKASLLEQFPNLGAPLNQEVRRLSVPGTPYLVVYAFEVGGVSVLRVFDSRQDWQHQVDVL